MTLPHRPVVIDIDQSVGPLADRLVLSVAHWQEALRFGCSMATMRRFRSLLEELLPTRHGTVMLGSGDFHHLSWPLIERAVARGARQVVVLDNHPDNMRYAFGVHCGSWVRHVARLPEIQHVHVVGISSRDVDRAHAWQNYLAPLREGFLSYWCLDVGTRWPRWTGADRAIHAFADRHSLIEAFCAAQARNPLPTYLSIDKDVFAPQVARTNWDQGQLQLTDALALIDGLRGGVVGSDITGEVSRYRYESRLKRWMSALDGQPPIADADLGAWQAQQHQLNLRLLPAIAACSM